MINPVLFWVYFKCALIKFLIVTWYIVQNYCKVKGK